MQTRSAVRDASPEDDDDDSRRRLLDEPDRDGDIPLRSTGGPVKKSREQSTRSILFSRRCLTVVGIVIFGLSAMLVAGGFVVYKHAPADGESPPWYPSPPGGSLASWEESYAKAAKLVERMSLPGKVNITTGTGWSMGLAVGNTGPADDLFPGLALQDGPLGLRFADNATAWPAGITVGATWNRDLMYRRGKAHGLEARLKGINVLLGPCVGPLGRMPAGGRNWEGFGSDPYLQGVAAAETIKGIQSEHVIATIKHYIGNEQEHFRQSFEWVLPNAMSSNIGDRTLHELYLWPFADAVRAGVGSVMCSYQMTNNSYSCGNSKLLNGILKDELGFQGFVQSDWLAARSGVASALAGLDMTMPGDGLLWAQGTPLWGPELTKAVLNGSLPMTRLNDMVTRVVAAWYQMGQDDLSLFDRKGPNFSSWTNEEMGVVNFGSPDDKEQVIVNQYVDVASQGKESHALLARQIAAEGSVLVKNVDGTLPLFKSFETPFKIGIYGDDAGEGKYHDPNSCADRGCNEGTLGSGWGSGAVEFPYLVTPLEGIAEMCKEDSNIILTDSTTNDLPEKSSLSAQDLCLVFVNSDAGEGYLSWNGIRGDRNDLNIQKDGDALVSHIASSCGGPTVVVVHAVGPVVIEEWIEHANVKAVILANLPGQESGHAIADILFGETNPSGRLPYTIPKSLADFGEAGQVLYYPTETVPQQDFKEGVLIDYRHFDYYDIPPRFEFGFGLSYSKFHYADLAIEEIKAKSRLPDPRPDQDEAVPPSYSTELPDPQTALFPAGLCKLSKFVYPYLSPSDLPIVPSSHDPTDRATEPTGAGGRSAAGGGEGGNPSHFATHLRVTCTVTNTGPAAGHEVAQLYLESPSSSSPSSPHNTKEGEEERQGEKEWRYDTDMSMMPRKVLRGFEKVWLEVGEARQITFDLTRRDLSSWDTAEQNWVMPMEGSFVIHVGPSSRILPLNIVY